MTSVHPERETLGQCRKKATRRGGYLQAEGRPYYNQPDGHLEFRHPAWRTVKE